MGSHLIKLAWPYLELLILHEPLLFRLVRHKNNRFLLFAGNIVKYFNLGRLASPLFPRNLNSD